MKPDGSPPAALGVMVLDLHESSKLLGRSGQPDELKALVEQTYRTDLYRGATRHLGMAFPESDYQPDQSHDEVWHLAPGLQMGPDRIFSADYVPH